MDLVKFSQEMVNLTKQETKCSKLFPFETFIKCILNDSNFHFPARMPDL